MRTQMIGCGAMVLLASLLTSENSTAQGQWQHTLGVDYSTGDYGGDPVDTDILYVPYSLEYETERWEVKATIPWVEIEGPGTVIGAGEGGVVIGDPSEAALTERTESGLGDIWLGATYKVPGSSSRLFYLDLTGKVKLSTADEKKGLGTGEEDYTLQADIFQTYGKVTPFATAAYKIKGDPPGFELKDVVYLSGGLDFEVTEQSHIGASLDFQEATTSTSDERLEFVAYLNQDLNSRWAYTLYGYKGLEDGSPDYGGGLQLIYTP